MTFYDFLTVLGLLFLAAPGAVTWLVVYAREDAHLRVREHAARRKRRRVDRAERRVQHRDTQYVQRVTTAHLRRRLPRALRAVLAHEHLAENTGDGGFDAHATEALDVAAQSAALPPLPTPPRPPHCRCRTTPTPDWPLSLDPAADAEHLADEIETFLNGDDPR